MGLNEEGGGGEDPSQGGGGETDVLLNDTAESTANGHTHDDQPERPEGGEPEDDDAAEAQPLVGGVDSARETPVRQSTAASTRNQSKLSTTPSSTTKLVSSVPIMVTIDPSDRVSLNTGML